MSAKIAIRWRSRDTVVPPLLHIVMRERCGSRVRTGYGAERQRNDDSNFTHSCKLPLFSVRSYLPNNLHPYARTRPP